MTDKETLIFGIHSIEALFSTQASRIVRLYVSGERHDHKIQSIINLANTFNIAIRQVSRYELDRMAQQGNHQGVVAQCQKAKSFTENDLAGILEKNPKLLLLILDSIQDPHNLGACLRSADAAGVHAVIAPKDKSVGLTPTVCKVACGAAETVPFIQVTNLARTMRYLQECGIWIFGAAGEAEKNLYQADFNLSLALVLGAEGSGLRRLTREHCDMLFKIPMQGHVASLNVSVATAIFLFEVQRQRTMKI